MIRNPDILMKEIDLFIEENMSEANFSIQQLTEVSGYSRMSVYRFIKKQTGLTPSQYLLNKRLTVATYYLKETNQPINMIAKSTGFKKAAYFSKKFKENFGCTPTAYVKINKTSA